MCSMFGFFLHFILFCFVFFFAKSTFFTMSECHPFSLTKGLCSKHQLWKLFTMANLVAETKLSCSTFQHYSTTVSVENYPPLFWYTFQEAWNSAYRYFSLKNDTNNWWCKQNVLHRLQFKFDWEKKKSRWQEQKQRLERTRPKYFTVSLWVKRPQVVYKLIIIIIIIIKINK